jgi:hypothetical protein
MSMRITSRVRVGLALEKRWRVRLATILPMALAPALLFAQTQATSNASVDESADEKL